MNTFERMRMVVAKELKLPPERIAPQTDLVALCGDESLAVMELLLALEDEFGLPLADSTGGMRTVEEIVGVIDRAGVAGSAGHAGDP